MRRIQNALKARFNLSIASENQTMDVYVVTAPYGPGPGLHPAEDSMGGSTSTSGQSLHLPEGQQPTAEQVQREMDKVKASSGITLDSISVDGGTVEDFCRTLEADLDRKMIDETHLTGYDNFELKRGNRTRDEFFELMREQLGLVVTPAQRDVPMLVVRSK
jgi:uncharacterized protein (TIGR03435 family)